MHTPTCLVKRGVRALKESLLTIMKAGERFGKASDISLEVMRNTPHTRLKKRHSNFTTVGNHKRKLVFR